MDVNVTVYRVPDGLSMLFQHRERGGKDVGTITRRSEGAKHGENLARSATRVGQVDAGKPPLRTACRNPDGTSVVQGEHCRAGRSDPGPAGNGSVYGRRAGFAGACS